MKFTGMSISSHCAAGGGGNAEAAGPNLMSAPKLRAQSCVESQLFKNVTKPLRPALSAASVSVLNRKCANYSLASSGLTIQCNVGAATGG